MIIDVASPKLWPIPISKIPDNIDHHLEMSKIRVKEEKCLVTR